MANENAQFDETECDNPISLDEIEKGLWLGMYFAFSTICNAFAFLIKSNEISQGVSLQQLILIQSNNGV